MIWREHKIGYVSGMYSLTPAKVRKSVQLYDVRWNGNIIKLTECTLGEATEYAEQHAQKRAT